MIEILLFLLIALALGGLYWTRREVVSALASHKVAINNVWARVGELENATNKAVGRANTAIDAATAAVNNNNQLDAEHDRFDKEFAELRKSVADVIKRQVGFDTQLGNLDKAATRANDAAYAAALSRDPLGGRGL